MSEGKSELAKYTRRTDLVEPCPENIEALAHQTYNERAKWIAVFRWFATSEAVEDGIQNYLEAVLRGDEKRPATGRIVMKYVQKGTDHEKYVKRCETVIDQTERPSLGTFLVLAARNDDSGRDPSNVLTRLRIAQLDARETK